MYTKTIREPINPEFVFEANLGLHPWISPWSIHVSEGLASILSEFLSDIESILGPKPDLAFLMITEELNGNGRDCDISALYQRRFRVFIEPKKYLKARNEAILYVVAAAIEKSLETCFRCGHTLEYKNIKDKDERELYPFLPVVSKNANDFGSSSANICLECALRDYQKDQKAIDDVIVDPDDDGTAARWDEIKTAEKSYLQAKEKAKENAMNKSRADYELNEFNTFVNEEEGGLAVSDEKTELVAIMAVPIKPEVAIFSTDEVDKLAKAYADAPRDQAARVKSIVKKIRNGSPIKQLATIPDDWREYCDDLAKRFPNFGELVLFIRNQFALAAASDKVFRLPPVILNGPPGCGKSFFALALASDLKSVLQVIDISSSQTGSPLTGSELYWANSQPGILFNTIVLGDIANPIFIRTYALTKCMNCGLMFFISGISFAIESATTVLNNSR